MSDINLSELLEEPEFFQKARDFGNQTTWDLYSKYIQQGVRIGTTTSELFQRMRTGWIENFRHLANNDGIIKLTDLPYGQSGNLEVDNRLFYDLNEMDQESREADIFSADNIAVSASINFEKQGTLGILEYNWDEAENAVSEICERAVKAGGMLQNELSSIVYSRADGTVCVQIFFSFIFNDFDKPQDLEYMVKNVHEIMEITRNNYKFGYQQFSINAEEN